MDHLTQYFKLIGTTAKSNGSLARLRALGPVDLFNLKERWVRRRVDPRRIVSHDRSLIK
jgi:hypothetical protein